MTKTKKGIGQRYTLTIPYWNFEQILREKCGIPLSFNKFDMNYTSPPLEIPPHLFKNLLQNRLSVLTTKQVANLFEVHPETIRRWNRLGLIKRHSISGHYGSKFLMADIVDALLNSPYLQQLLNRKRTDTFTKVYENTLLAV